MLLDQVVQGTSGRSSDTDLAVSQFGRALPFRGLLKDVRGTRNGEFLAKSQLAFKVHEMPVAVVGKTETRPAEGYKALVRGDTGGILDITSDVFKIHQNDEIVADMQAMAEAGNAEILFAGPLNGGRKVVAIAKLNGDFTMKDKRHQSYRNDHAGVVRDDKTFLFVVISGGHEVGTPCKIRGMAFRRWCLNGAFFTELASSTYTKTHRSRLTSAERVRMQRCYDSIRMEFDAYAQNAEKLQEVEMQKEQTRLYVAELLKPGITLEIGAKLEIKEPGGVWKEVADSIRGKQALDAMIKESEALPGFKRSGNNLLEAIINQEGANGNNLWTGYNGITWYVDHKRGRNDESGQGAALFGAGAVLKEQALRTAMKFVQ